MEVEFADDDLDRLEVDRRKACISKSYNGSDRINGQCD